MTLIKQSGATAVPLGPSWPHRVLAQPQLGVVGTILALASRSRVCVPPPCTRTPRWQQDPAEASKRRHTDRRQLRVHGAVS